MRSGCLPLPGARLPPVCMLGAAPPAQCRAFVLLTRMRGCEPIVVLLCVAEAGPLLAEGPERSMSGSARLKAVVAVPLTLHAGPRTTASVRWAVRDAAPCALHAKQFVLCKVYSKLTANHSILPT